MRTIIEHHVQPGRADAAVQFGHAHCARARMRRSSTTGSFDRRAEHPHRYAGRAARSATAAADSSPIVLGGGLVRALARRALDRAGGPPGQLFAAGGPRGAPRRLRQRRHSRRAGHPQPANGARDRERHQPRDLQQQGGGRCRRGAVRIRSSPAAGCCCRPTAEIDSRPQLEIHTDEVKCAHGATTGRLDPEHAFLHAVARPGPRAPRRACWCTRFSPTC